MPRSRPSVRSSVRWRAWWCGAALLAGCGAPARDDEALRVASAERPAPARRTRALAERGYQPRVEQPSDEARAALATLQVADGLEASLWAAEPLLANPVCFAVDDATGAVYVGETFRHTAGVTDIRDHMDWLDDDLAAETVADRLAMYEEHLGDELASYTVQSERVRRLRDTDGDGTADTATVFADDFADPLAGIGAGLLARDGDVYYTCIPELLRLRDRDGDGRADEAAVLHDGFGVRVALLGHDLHGLRLGPDGRLYLSIGDRGFHLVNDEGALLASPDRGAVLRCELDGTGLAVVHSGLRNPQELVFDDLGNLWTGDNNSDGGDQARWVWVVQGADSGWRQPFQWLSDRGPWNRESLWKPHEPGRAAYVLPPIANLADGPSGLACAPGTGLSARWRDHFFLCDFRGGPQWSGVHAFTVAPRAASYELVAPEPFVWNVLATDCDFAEDGSLLVSDWVDGWQVTGKGRLWRLADADADVRAEGRATAALLAEGMRTRDDDALLALLAHGDRRVRTEAELELAARGAAGALREATAEGRPRLQRLHGLWGLGVLARRGASALLDDVAARASDDDVEVRAQVFVVLERDGRAAPLSASVADAVRAGLDDREPRVRLLAGLAAGALAVDGTRAALRRMLVAASDVDPYLRHGAVIGLDGTADDDDLAALLRDADPSVRLGAVLVLRRRADPAPTDGRAVRAAPRDAARLALALGDADALVADEAARAVHDLPVREALPALAGLCDAALAARSDAFARRALDACFRLGRAQDARRVASAARDEALGEPLRAFALALLLDWTEPSPKDRVLGCWRPLAARPEASAFLPDVAASLAVDGLLHGPPELAESTLELLAATRAPGVAPAVEALFADDAVDGGVRARALGALDVLAPDAASALVDRALDDRVAAVRARALELLDARAPDEVLPRLPDVLLRGELSEVRSALALLARSDDARAVELLGEQLDALDAGELPDELALDVVLAAEAHDDGALAPRLERHAQRRASDDLVAPWRDALHGGDPDAGRTLFERAELQCTKCHASGAGERERVGPNLAGAAGRLGRLGVLAAIVDPNRRIAHGFGQTNVFLRDGSVVTGRLLGDASADPLRLLDAEGEVREVAASDVEELRAGLSAMPEDLVRPLAREELRDLVAYVCGL